MFANFLFMIAPFRVESLNNKWSGMEPSVSRTFRYLEPNLVSIEFASLRLYLERAVLDTPDNSNQFWLPWYKLTPDNSNQGKFPNHLVRMSITFSPLRWLYIPFYVMCINNVFRWQMLANHIALGWRSIISYSVRLHTEDSFRTLMLFLWQLLREMVGLFCGST